MPPSEFYVRLQHGITGGFAPPTPSAVHTLVRSSQSPSSLVINSSIRPDGTPTLQEAQPKTLNVDTHTALIDELESILKTIPVESPPGIEDIYGLDTGIAWGSENLQWANGGPGGCGTGESQVKATEEDKKKFKRAVEIVNELVKQDA